MIADLLYIARYILPDWWRKQKRLKQRRNNSWRSHIHLTRRFHEITRDLHKRG